MSIPEAERLRVVRTKRSRRLAGFLILAGVAGLGALAYSAAHDRGDDTPVSSTGPAPDLDPSAPATDRPRPAAGPAPAAPARPGPVRELRVLVLSVGGPEPGVFVRAVEHDATAASQRDCAAGRTTDGSGVAVLAVEDPAPPGAYLEVAKADATGLRHGYAALAPALAEAAASPKGEAVLALPEGGSLRVAFRGLPPEARPREITVSYFAPFGEWLELFRDLRVVPVSDGGLQECRAVPRFFRFPVGEDGDALVRHAPTDLAVTVSVPRWPTSYVVEKAASTSPSMEATDGDVLRVPEGSETVYTLAWRRRPEARVRVVDEAGRPIVGARVAVGVRRAGRPTRLFDDTSTADANGLASVPLWTGARLPGAPPEGLVVVASARGRRAAVVEAPGRWYGPDVEATLVPGGEGRFALAGRLAFEDGKPAPGVPVLLASAEPWNGHAAVGPFPGVTDENGDFRLEAPEDLRAVFAFGEGLRVQVDGERLEATPAGALWRALWPTLPRARVSPASVPLPPTGGTARATATLVLP